MDAQDDTEELERKIEEARAELRAQLEATDERITENRDGSLIVELIEPITFGNDEKHIRLTVGRVKVRHVRDARNAPDELEAYADALVEPRGAFDELFCDADYMAVCRAVERALGKFRAAGSPS